MVVLAVVSALAVADSVLLLLHENKNIAKHRHKKILFIIIVFKLKNSINYEISGAVGFLKAQNFLVRQVNPVLHSVLFDFIIGRFDGCGKSERKNGQHYSSIVSAIS